MKKFDLGTQLLFGKTTEEDINKFLNLLTNMETNRKSVLSQIGNEAAGLVASMVDDVIVRNKLGKEWTKPLLDFVINGLFIPPFQNLSMSFNKEAQEITLGLNSTTTIEDVREAWDLVSIFQKKVFGSPRRTYITRNKIKDFGLFAKLIESKQKNRGQTYLDMAGKLFPEEEDISSKADLKRAAKLRQIKKRMSKQV